MKTRLRRRERSQRISASCVRGFVIVMGLAAFGFSSPLGARAQTTLLSEGFEGVFPGSSWTVGDASGVGIALWNDVDSTFGGEGTHGGNWKGYCAGINFLGTSTNPMYRDSMNTFMEQTIDLRGYSTATLEFWYKIPSIESCCDYLRVKIAGSELATFRNSVSGWTSFSTDISFWTGSLRTLRFEFFSDSYINGEGAYLDDISVRAVQSTASFGGFVRDANTGSPISGATVQWGALTRTTDGSGRYSFDSVSCGSATLTVSRTGYVTYSEAFFSPLCNASSAKDAHLIADDFDDQISEAISFGAINQTHALNGNISGNADVDMFSFSVVAGQRISFDVDLPPGSSLDPHIRLFNGSGGSGAQLSSSHDDRGPGELSSRESYLEYPFASPGTYYVGVSAHPNTAYNAINGGGDTSGNTTGPYALVVSPGLAGTVRREGNSRDYPIDLLRFGPNPPAITPALPTWIVVHGRANSRNTDHIKRLTEAIVAARPSNEQVLTVDWEGAADDGVIDFDFDGENAIKNVAAWLSQALTNLGFSSGNLNFVGPSWGAYVSAETAELIPGGVNTIVGLDPAEDFPGGYSPDSVGEIDFSGHSRFSWAFHSSFYGSEYTPSTAHESFVIPHEEVPSTSAHNRPIHMFVYMLGHRTGQVSALFQPDRLLSSQPRPWCQNQYTSYAPVRGGRPGYEAYVDFTEDGLAPESITYVDCSIGREITVPEVPDSVPPTLLIESPTTQPTYESTSRLFSPAGSASDNVRVKRVTWSNDRGGSGVAAGTISWVAGGIALQEGQNVIAITARDVAGNIGSDVITVTHQPVTLTVLSFDPDSAVPIGIAPTDNNGQADGNTPFSRRYDKTTVVSLTAPAAIGCNSFVSWERDGSVWSLNPSTALAMDAQHSVVAVYAPRPPRVVHIDCRFAGSDPDGSSERPFPRIAPGYSASCNGDTLRIFSCNYSETIRMTKALRVEAINGTVNIGRP